MKNLNLKLSTTLLLSTTQIYASDMDAQLIGYALLILIPCITIFILYIISQNKLIDILKIDNLKFKTHKLWTWTQVVPIWSFIAQIVAIVKMTDQYKVYIRENNIKPDAISEYKPLWGWLFVGFSIFSMIIPFLAIIAFIFWIIYWINISSTTKSIQHYLHNLKN